MEVLRKYGTATTIIFPLVDRGTLDLVAGVTIATSDIKISKDEGAFNDVGASSLFVDRTLGMYSVAVTAVQMQFARGSIRVVDQTGTKEWEDQIILISTYGHASAQHSDSVHDEARADHVIPGSFGEGMLVEDLNTAAKASVNTEVDTGINDAALATAASLATVDTAVGALNDYDPTAQMTESYAVNGVVPTRDQMMFAIHQMLMQFGISGTSLTVRKLDNTTTAFLVTLDDATNPTGAERT